MLKLCNYNPLGVCKPCFLASLQRTKRALKENSLEESGFRSATKPAISSDFSFPRSPQQKILEMDLFIFLNKDLQTNISAILFRQTLNNQLVWRLEVEGKLHPKQFGYRLRKSTFDALPHLTELIYNSFEDKAITIAVMVNLEAAFDKILHSTIILHYLLLGIRWKILKFVWNLNTNRKIKTKVNNSISDKIEVLSDFPQGFVLSSTFLI